MLFKIVSGDPGVIGTGVRKETFSGGLGRISGTPLWVIDEMGLFKRKLRHNK